MAKPDWEAIETAYRAGVMSLRDIGALYGVTEGAIRKKAKKLEWVRKDGTQVRKNGTQKNTVRTTRRPASSGAVHKHSQPEAEPPADTKPETVRKKVVTNHPPFQPGIPGPTININVPSQATALPTENRTTTDETPEDEKNKDKTTDEGVPEWAVAILARLDALEGKTADDAPDDITTADEDAEEDSKVTGDAAFKRNLIADAEIICPGFQPAGDKGLKRQVLNHALRTGDSLKAFGVSDFSKAPKSTVDAVFKAAVEINKAKNHLLPLNNGVRTTDGSTSTKHMSPAELNKINADFWKNRK